MDLQGEDAASASWDDVMRDLRRRTPAVGRHRGPDEPPGDRRALDGSRRGRRGWARLGVVVAVLAAVAALAAVVARDAGGDQRPPARAAAPQTWETVLDGLDRARV